MDKEMLNQLREIFKEELRTELEPIKADIKEIKQKINSVYDQTADLTEFRTETKQGIENIQKDINKLTNVTKTNCFDIADLKAVR